MVDKKPIAVEQRVELDVLPRLALNPDARIVRWIWLAWIVLTFFVLIAGFRLVAGDSARGLSWVAMVPLLALWLLWPVAVGASALWRWMRAAPHAAWNDSYYEFDGRQMRMLFDADEVFVIANDVFAALGLRGHATDAQRVRQLAGRDGLVQLPARRELVFTQRGLAAWLERRTDEKAVRFRKWYELQVIAPHAKRRAMASGFPGADPD